MPRSLPGLVTGLRSTNTSPAVGSSNPAMMRSSVDFPQPEAPIRHTNSPSRIVRSTRASASISASPAMKRLVTPRIARRVWGGSLAMMLRAPAQKPVRDHDDDPVGQESERSDHDHAGHHKIGARERPAIHDHRTKAGRHAGHLADDDQDPREAMRNAKAVDDCRERGRKHDLAEHRRAGAAEHRGSL